MEKISMFKAMRSCAGYGKLTAAERNDLQQTIYIPKFLEVNVNDIQKPIVPLSSNDKGQNLGYHFDFEIAPGDQPYEGIIKGNLVCMNLDTSAVLFPYRTGIMFNQ